MPSAIQFPQLVSPRPLDPTILAWVTNQHIGHIGFNKSCNQAAHVPSSKVTYTVPCSPPRNSRTVGGFGFQNGFHDGLALGIQHGYGDRSARTSTLKKNLTPPALSEMPVIAKQGRRW